MFSRAGICPSNSTPTVSMIYFPTSPLEFASPLGNLPLFEFSMMRTVSPLLAASTTAFAFTRSSFLVVLSM